MGLAQGPQRALRIAVGCLIAGFIGAPFTAAAAPTLAELAAIRQACRADFRAYCADVPLGGHAGIACLQGNAARLSPGCRQALAAAEGGAAASASAPPPRPPAVATPVATEWPHTVQGEAGSALVYQPQVISWPEHRTLNTRMAVGITPTGARAPILGTVDVSFSTQTDLSTRSVTLTAATLTASRFPSSDTSQAVRFEQRIRAALAAMGAKQVPLDTVLMSLPQGSPPADAAVKNDPPTIFVSASPASLVVFDGEPVLAPVTGTSLSFAVNTN